jgi:hypothetical protein
MNIVARWDEAEPDNHLPERKADSTEEAVFIGKQPVGSTIIIGREDSEEWVTTDDMRPLSVEEYR